MAALARRYWMGLPAGRDRSRAGGVRGGSPDGVSEHAFETLDDASQGDPSGVGTAIGLGHSVEQPDLAIFGRCIQVADSGFDVDVPHGRVSFADSGPDSAWPWGESMTIQRKSSVKTLYPDAARGAKNP
jgi:hypothetical protein